MLTLLIWNWTATSKSRSYETGEIVVRANFDFNKNEYEASGDPEKQEFAQSVKEVWGYV